MMFPIIQYCRVSEPDWQQLTHGMGLLETDQSAKLMRINVIVTKGCHVDASITQSPRKPKTKPSYEVVNDREDRDDEDEAKP